MFSLCSLSVLLLIHRPHHLTDLRFAWFSSHLHEHCTDHLFVDRRIFPDLLFKISLCDKEADQCPNDSAGNKPAQCRPKLCHYLYHLFFFTSVIVSFFIIAFKRNKQNRFESKRLFIMTARGVICSLLCRGGYPWSSVRIPGRTRCSTRDSPVRIPLYQNVGKILSPLAISLYQ